MEPTPGAGSDVPRSLVVLFDCSFTKLFIRFYRTDNKEPPECREIPRVHTYCLTSKPKLDFDF